MKKILILFFLFFCFFSLAHSEVNSNKYFSILIKPISMRNVINPNIYNSDINGMIVNIEQSILIDKSKDFPILLIIGCEIIHQNENMRYEDEFSIFKSNITSGSQFYLVFKFYGI